MGEGPVSCIAVFVVKVLINLIWVELSLASLLPDLAVQTVGEGDMAAVASLSKFLTLLSFYSP